MDNVVIFAAPMNIMNAIMDMNPILLNFFAFSILSCKLKKPAIENIITIITAIETKNRTVREFGRRNEEIVNKIRNPPIIFIKVNYGFRFQVFTQLVFISRGDI